MAFAPGRWLEHFEKHGDEFGYRTSVEYLRGAQQLTAGGEGADGGSRVLAPSDRETLT